MKQTDNVREFVREQYVEPARRQHRATIRIVAGEVQKSLRLQNRTPLVCAALKSRKFLQENNLTLEKLEGPPSGMSTTVVFTYRLMDEDAKAEQPDPFMALRGIAKEAFQSLGGAEAFIRKERDEFYGPGRDA